MKNVKFVREKRPFRIVPLILLAGLLGAIVAFPIQGRLLYTLSGDSQSPSFEQVDSSQADSSATSDDHATHSHEPIGHLPDQGRFTKPGEPDSWPPQYRGADNVEWDEEPTSLADDAGSGSDFAMSEAKRVAESHADVRDLLGTRSTFINTAPIKIKWQDEAAGHTITWFSYSNNVTIEAVVENGEVVEVREHAAADYQPPLRQNEVDEAITIARQYWIDQGQDQVDALLGYTIQTLKTDGDGGYYDTRMTYVSFHADPSSEPELMTWVDLTHQTVLQAVVDTAVTDVQELVPADAGVTE